MSLRSTILAIALASSLTAQAADTLTQVIVPSPWGIVLTLGRWLINSGERVYEVRVEGRGHTPEQARENGWRLAIQRAVGTLNLHQAERVNGDLVLDRQILYSSGFVRDWRELRQYQTSQGQWAVEMDVWVRHSSIADGLVGHAHDPQTFEGSRQWVQVHSRDQQAEQAHQLLSAVLAAWPGAAVEITKSGPVRTEYLANRQVVLIVQELELGMSPQYQRSLHEVLDKISTQRPHIDDWMFLDRSSLWAKRWRIRDPQLAHALLNRFAHTVRVRATLRNNNQVIDSHVIDVGLTRLEDRREPKGFQLPVWKTSLVDIQIPVNKQDLARINRVDFEVEPLNPAR